MDPTTSAILSSLIPPLTVALAAALAALLIPRALATWQSLPAQQQALLAEVAATVVSAVEQVMATAPAAAKRDAAIRWAQRHLDALGLQVDLHDLDLAIEAAVMAEFNRDRAAWPITPGAKPWPTAAAPVAQPIPPSPPTS